MDMTYWCESCARKNYCYTIRSRPKCFTPITNTAQGAPESYLAKALRFSRDSHEIAEQTEPNSSEKPNNCETCRHYTLACDLFSEICKYEPKDEPQTERSE